MARQRDYAAERARRNEIARAEGYASYDAKRYAKETGRYKPPGKTSGKSPAKAPAKRQRDWSEVYRRRQAKARREGYENYNEKKRHLARLKAAIDKIRAAFGDRPKYNEARTKARHAEMDDEELDLILELDADEMNTIMARGKPAGHRSELNYH